MSVIDSVSFSSIYTFYNTSAGNYYIQTKHRNSIETWSKTGGESPTPGLFSSYNFTSRVSQEYGNNLILSGSKYCVFSGDIDQSGFIELDDIIKAYNAASVFASGYSSSDVTGDRMVDLDDVVLTHNNSGNFISKIVP